MFVEIIITILVIIDFFCIYKFLKNLLGENFVNEKKVIFYGVAAVVIGMCIVFFNSILENKCM